jgi:hypothetical protein
MPPKYLKRKALASQRQLDFSSSTAAAATVAHDTIPSSPQGKSYQQVHSDESIDSYSSSSNNMTNAVENDNDGKRESKRPYLSSPPRKRTDVSVVTPATPTTQLRLESQSRRTKGEDAIEDEIDGTGAEEPYVPVYLYKNIHYHCGGTTSMSPTLAQCVRLIRQHYHVPPEHEPPERQRPLSGMTYEERLVQEYSLGRLQPRSSCTTRVSICTACAEVGHVRWDCPTLI